MNDVCIYYANGTKLYFSVFPYEKYEEGRLAGYIIKARELNWFEKFLVKLFRR